MAHENILPVEGEQTRDDKVRVAVNKVQVFCVQGVDFEYAEQEGDKGEEEDTFDVIVVAELMVARVVNST
jgi:hypothetical protein